MLPAFSWSGGTLAESAGMWRRQRPDSPRPGAPGLALVVLLLLAYLAMHFALRLAVPNCLKQDEAEQLFFCQSLEWGYSGQPPLYTWLLWPLFQCLGEGIAALALLKAAVLFCTYLCLYLSARLVLRDARGALLAGFSGLLIPDLAWNSVVDLTHTALAVAACAATLYVVLRLTDSPGWGWYSALGALIGLGTLSKYNYLLFALPLLAAGLSLAPFRARILDRRMLLALAIAAVVVLPHGLWVLENWSFIQSFLAERTQVGEAPSYLQGVLRGAGSLANSAACSLAVWFPLCAICFPRALRPDAVQQAGRTDGARLLERFFLALLVLLACQIVLAGSTYFKARWLHPCLIFVPLVWFARVDARDLAGRRFACFAAVLLAAGLCGGAWRAAKTWELTATYSRLPFYRMDFTPLAEELRSAGAEQGAILAGDHWLAGNLRLHLPQARVLCSEYPLYMPAPAGEETCRAIVWSSNRHKVPPPCVAAFARQALGRSIPQDQRPQVIRAAIPRSSEPPYQFGVLVLR